MSLSLSHFNFNSLSFVFQINFIDCFELIFHLSSHFGNMLQEALVRFCRKSLFAKIWNSVAL